MTTPITTSTTDSQIHNNIMAAGSRDHPQMLAPGRYALWQSRFLRYIDTRPNGDALMKCILEGPYQLTTVIILAVPATENSPAILERTTVETILIQQHDLDTVSDHKLFDVLKQYQKEVNEIRAERITKNANPLALVATAQQYPDPYYQTPKSHKLFTPPSKQASSTRSNASTKFKVKEIAKPITPPSESASEEDSDPEQAQRDKDMQKIWHSLQNWTVWESEDNDAGARETVGMQETKRVKDSTYHKEKMLLCQQAKKGVPLQVEQVDWLEDMDEEIDEQGLEAHYSFMTKIQEVPIAASGTDTELLEQDDSNVTPDSPDMCDNDIQTDQNVDDERAAPAKLIANLKLDVDENKKIQKQLKKANASLAQE
ncbi:hypothetical protein Tco_1530082, partial [Tanacetum coccineum]